MQAACVRQARFAAGLLALALLGAPFIAPGPASEEPEAPLTDEDVVRLHVTGLEQEPLIERIRAAEVAFDLSDEMLAELRAAGLPEPVIRAMVERQRELDAERSAPDEPVEPAPPSAPRLRVMLNPADEPGDEDRPSVLRVLDVVDDSTYDALRLRGEAAAFTDAALVLACRTADHVPDHWRGKTPLGRDFVLTPRHRLLAFHPGATRREVGELRSLAENLALVPGERKDRPEPGVLELELPPFLEVELEPGIVHDLTLGIALQAEERYYLVAADEWDGFVMAEEGASIDARIESGRGGALRSLEVRFEETPRAVE